MFTDGASHIETVLNTERIEWPKLLKMMETHRLAVGPVYAQLRLTCTLEASADSYVVIPLVYLWQQMLLNRKFAEQVGQQPIR